MGKRHFWISRIIPLLALAGLIWLLSAIGWERIADAFRRIGPEGALVLVACGVVEALFDSLALHQAALGRSGFWRVHIVNQTGAFLNMVAPAEAGEFLKASLLARDGGRNAATATLVWNMASRLVKSSLIFLAAAASFFSLPLLRHQTALCLGFAFLNIGVYAAFSLTLRFGGVGRVVHLLSRLPFLKGTRARNLVSHVQEAEKKSSRFRHEHPLRYATILLAMIGARATGFLTIWGALQFLEADYSFFLCVLIYAAAELASYVIAVMPTRIGTTEGSAFLIFQFLGLGGGFGVVLQLILRLKQLFVTGSFLAIGEILHWVPSPRKLLRGGKTP